MSRIPPIRPTVIPPLYNFTKTINGGNAFRLFKEKLFPRILTQRASSFIFTHDIPLRGFTVIGYPIVKASA